MKTNVSFRVDQAELVVSCLEFVRMRLDKDLADGAHKFVAGPFTYKRIAEIISLFDDEPAYTAASHADQPMEKP